MCHTQQTAVTPTMWSIGASTYETRVYNTQTQAQPNRTKSIAKQTQAAPQPDCLFVLPVRRGPNSTGAGAEPPRIKKKIPGILFTKTDPSVPNRSTGATRVLYCRCLFLFSAQTQPPLQSK